MDAAMNSAVSALQAQSSALSTVSNNLANSQTTGYKAVDTQFLSLLTQESQGISFPSGGVLAVARQNLMDQGLIQSTSTTTDMAINGNGLFPVSYGLGGSQTMFTRNGAFDTDSKGNLVLSGTNYYLMGWATDATGKVLATNPDNVASLQNVNVSKFNSSAVATTNYSLQANLPAEAQSQLKGISYTTAAGGTNTMDMSFVKTGSNSANANAGGDPTTTYLLTVDGPSGITVSDGSTTTTTTANQLQYSVTVDNTTGAFVTVQGLSTPAASAYNGNALPSLTDANGDALTWPVDSNGNATWSALTAQLGTPFSQQTSFTVYDSLGVQQTFPVTWTAAGNNSWVMSVGSPTNPAGTASTGRLQDSAGNSVPSVSYMVNFNSDGTLNGFTPLSAVDKTGSLPATPGTAPETTSLDPQLFATWSDGAAPSTGTSAVALNLGTFGAVGVGKSDGLSQFDTGQSSPLIAVKSTSQNGVQYGQLTGVSVDSSGNVIAAYDNGQKVPIYKIPVATFPNINGLQAANDGVYGQSSLSGNYMLNQAGTNGAGSVEGGALESSNVNTSVEFSNMITAQQAYSSASQVIKTDQQNFQALIQVIQ